MLWCCGGGGLEESWPGLCELQARSGGFAYFMWGINVLGPGDLSADLTIVQNDKCIDSCGACLCSRIRSTIMHGAKCAYRGELVDAKRNSNGGNRCLVAQIVCNRRPGGQKDGNGRF